MKNVTILNAKNQISMHFNNEDVEDLLFEFLKDRTPLTELAYRNDLKHFFAYTLEQFGVPKFDGKSFGFNDIKRVHIVKYKKFLENCNSLRRKPYAPNSINRKLSS